MRNFLMVASICLAFAFGSTAEAQVRVGFDQLDRIEEKLDESLERLDRIEQRLATGGGGRTELYQVISSVDTHCVASLCSLSSGPGARLKIANRCRVGDLQRTQNECRETSRAPNYECFNELSSLSDSEGQKADIFEACWTYTFECEREDRRR